MMRISLYPHELAVVERLTIELTRQSLQSSEVIGPMIFERLLDNLYARGNFKSRHYERVSIPEVLSTKEDHFQEVP